MKSITFKCEVVTPMFLAGADGSSPELRPPSIKGAMRFWWRAMNGDTDIDQLRKEEAKIFGVGGGKARRSRIVIKTTHPEWDGVFQSHVLPHKDKGLTKAFNPETPQFFEVSLSFSHELDDLRYDDLKSLFVLSCLLGGYGKRSRRGFGSVRIVGIKDSDDNEFKSFCMPKDLQEILELIKVFSSHYKLDAASRLPKICLVSSTDFSEPYPYITEIQIGETVYGDYKDIVHSIGLATHDYKSNDPSLGYAGDQDRFASPVYVSAIQYGPNDYRAIITTLHMAERRRLSANTTKQDAFKHAIL